MSRRKVEMVLDLVDRATRPVRKFMALQKRMGKVSALANRAAAKTARLAAQATNQYQRATKALARAQTALRNKISRTNAMIARQTARLRSGAGLMRSGIMGIGGAALVAGGMFVAYAGAVALAARSFLGPARQFENFGIQLESLEGSSAKGKAAMAWIEGFATKTPLELHQVVDSYQKLKAFGMDPTNGSLNALVDTMAASGKGTEFLNSTILAFGKSWTKGKMQTEEMMMLMERGVPVVDILGEKLGKSAEQILEMASKGKIGRKEIQLLLDTLGKKNAGASEKMSKTWDGIISNLMDTWGRFQRMVMGFGVFDWLKDKLRGLLDTLKRMEASGELAYWARLIASNMLEGLQAIWEFGKSAIGFWRQLQPWLKSAAVALGGWRNFALAVLAIPLRGVLIGAAFGMIQLAVGAGMVVTSLAGISFGAVAGGVLRFGSVLLGLLNPMNIVRGALFALRLAVIGTGIGAIVVGLAMAGIWIYNNWSGLKSFFVGFGAAFINALGPAGPLVEWVVQAISSLWGWLSDLLGPLSASSAQWAEWGATAGRWLGNVVGSVARFVGRVATWFGNLAVIDWLKSLDFSALRAGWQNVKAWVGTKLSNIWTGFKTIKWSELLGLTLLKSAWSGITGFISSTISNIWTGIKIIAWGSFLGYQILTTAWDKITGFIAGTAAFLWDLIPDFPDWGELINLVGLKDAWAKLTGFVSDAGAKLWDLIPEMPEWSLWGDDKIEDPKTLLAAAEAAKILEGQFPAINAAAQAALTGSQAAITSISTLLSATDFTSEGARLIQSLADGILSKKEAVRQAAMEIGQTIKSALPTSARANITVAGGSSAVQQRASGGAFNPGWLLTGEQGPELKYQDKGGYVAHNQALQNMATLSDRIRGNAANVNSRPARSGWLKGAAVSAGVAAATVGLPAAAMPTTAPPASATSGAQYLKASGGGNGPVSASLTVHIAGNVDKDTLPDLMAELEAFKEQIADLLEENARLSNRRAHS